MIYNYSIIGAQINNDGSLTLTGKRNQSFFSFKPLNVGGLYFLKPSKLYKIVELKEVTI